MSRTRDGAQPARRSRHDRAQGAEEGAGRALRDARLRSPTTSIVICAATRSSRDRTRPAIAAQVRGQAPDRCRRGRRGRARAGRWPGGRVVAAAHRTRREEAGRRSQRVRRIDLPLCRSVLHRRAADEGIAAAYAREGAHRSRDGFAAGEQRRAAGDRRRGAGQPGGVRRRALDIAGGTRPCGTQATERQRPHVAGTRAARNDSRERA